MPDGLVIKTKIKDLTELFIKMWFQKFMASFGLGIRQRLLTISCFWYFLVMDLKKKFFLFLIAGAVLQTPLSFIEWVGDPFVKISSKHLLSQTVRAREPTF